MSRAGRLEGPPWGRVNRARMRLVLQRRAACQDGSGQGCTTGGPHPAAWLLRRLPTQADWPSRICRPLPSPPLPRPDRSGRRGLEVLQACAQLLMREIGTESLASGLEVTVQASGQLRGGQRAAGHAGLLEGATVPLGIASLQLLWQLIDGFTHSSPTPSSPPFPFPCRAASSRSTPPSRRWCASACRSRRCALQFIWGLGN